MSGCGDGGLIDTLRIRLRDFDCVDFVRNYLSSEDTREVRTRLLSIEATAKELSFQSAGSYCFEQYEELPIPDHLLDVVVRRLRAHTRVTLHNRSPQLFSPRASLLNRFLVYLLLKCEGLDEFAFGEICGVSRDDDKTVVTTKHRDLDSIAKPYHAVILRHGPEAVIDKLIGPTSANAIRSRLKGQIDITAGQHWPVSFYGMAGVDKEAARRRRSCAANQLSSVYKTLDQAEQRVVACLKMRLNGIVGQITENFGATSSWLFLSNNDRLTSCVEHNTHVAGAEVQLGHGIVGRVAQLRQPYCVTDVALDSHYVEWVPETRSEIAVPIMADDNELLGVLNQR